MSKPLTLLFLVLSCLFCSCEFVFLWNNFHIDSHKISGLCGHMLSFLYLTEQKAKKTKKNRDLICHLLFLLLLVQVAAAFPQAAA